MRETVGHYRIVRKIGEGGMGVVYEARDERLGRTVALKTLAGDEHSEEARRRLWKEARSLARVSHPRICQLFDAGETDGTLFLVLELLEGRSLASRLSDGAALPVTETVGITRQILEALVALHALGIVHRDLKPSNVFLTPHGVKLLDFGLARLAIQPAEDGSTETALTVPGAIMGTPQYMAPEQAEGRAAGPAVDIFASGSLLFEMLSGRPAFRGASVVDVLYAVLHHNPPLLGGSREVESFDQVIRRAMAKRPEDRFSSARDMLAAVSAVPLAKGGSSLAVPALTVTRLIALPFRVLRKDEETDFLAYSLPDAISSSLSGADGIVVRSSLVASRFEGMVDPRRVAVEADVDAILTGSLVRAGDQIRLTCQLVEAPGGAVIWSGNLKGSMNDLFRLQDELCDRVVRSLVPSLSEREHGILIHDVPISARAYEFYLRANQVAAVRNLDNMRLARDLYLQCLQGDREYAPAWARLARVYRFLEKFGDDAVENGALAAEAFRKAFELNPDLPVAHNLYAQIECDHGRALPAMVKLLDRARFRRNDPDLFAGLVQTCRYCDELAASVSAHERAQHLDRQVDTSVAHTYFVLGNYRKTLETYGKGAYYLDCAALAAMGDTQTALSRLKQREQTGGATGVVQAIMRSLRACLEGDFQACLKEIEVGESVTTRDPEILFYMGRHLAHINERERAVRMLNRSIDAGYLCWSALLRDPWLETIRSSPGFAELRAKAEQMRRDVHAFMAAGGPEIIGEDRTHPARQDMLKTRTATLTYRLSDEHSDI